MLGQVLEEGGSSEDPGAKVFSLNDEFFAGFELVLLDGEDLSDEMKKVLVGSLTKTGSETEFALTAWKKLYMKWKKSSSPDSMEGFLTVLVVAETAAAEQKRKEKRKEEEEERRRKKEAEARKVAPASAFSELPSPTSGTPEAQDDRGRIDLARYASGCAPSA
jgi:hypothetical protein